MTMFGSGYTPDLTPHDAEDPEGPELPDVSTLTARSGGPAYRAQTALRGSLDTLTEARDTLRVDLQTAVRRWRDQREVAEALRDLNPQGSRAEQLVDASDRRGAGPAVLS
jgi:hypothetical protein